MPWRMLFALIFGPAVHGAETPLAHLNRVEVANAKTFVGIASVTMTMPVFMRAGAAFETNYRATVVPWVMFNEKGKLRVDLPDEKLRALARGEPVDFTGQALRDGGGERRIEGKATPVDATSGKLKVRVFYSKRIVLTFETTYRFAEPK